MVGTGRCSRSKGRPNRLLATRVNAQTQVRSPNVTEDTVELGNSGLRVSALGVGSWSWGDRTGYWGFGKEGNQKDDNRQAYQALTDAGITFIDTAEAYGFGQSEEFLAGFMKATNTQPVVATKFAPFPWRVTRGSVVSACKASLQRLQLDSVGLYMQHWPGFLTNGWSNDAFLEGLADCHEQGLAKAIGVSNFKEERLRKAHRALKARGVPLASNQVQYSLLYKAPERNGVLNTCQELGVSLVAYSPLCQGALTGKYTLDNRPSGPRSTFVNESNIRQIQPLLGLMREIAEGRGGKSLAQVAINWTICKGAIPIPGAKNARQAADIAGALGWRLTAEEVRALDVESDKLSVGVQAPFEKW
ncbi:hypothetical protein WJX72_007399 [[Myrmecia] bisecta]|uniref:NADP-dependent oxidoreductase domain-containing protein n=1 Tax=[Myrmecia] bisecta TaxID=41462 RepID=A0AAW1PFL5_9CHLO